jgi:hypothetical protein
MKAYKHLVRYALNAGHTVSVYDGAVWEVKRSTKYKTIIDCIESVEEAQLNIRDANGEPIAWALVSAYGLADDETVIDFGWNDFMKQWEIIYDNPHAERDTLIRAARELSTGIHGSFAAGIGDAALCADSHNLQILVNAFPDVFAKATGTETI